MTPIILLAPAVDRWEDHRINCERCYQGSLCTFGRILLRDMRRS